jgi:hypothetical protein
MIIDLPGRPPRYFHICANVREMLGRSDTELLDLYRCDPDQIPEIRTRMVIAMAQGHAFVPLHGVCDNFDPAQGCGGHACADLLNFQPGRV